MMKKFKYYILIALVTFILLLRLFTSLRFYGHDTIFHIGNIISLSQTISITNIFGKSIIQFLENPFGYGVGLFYPRLPHLIGAYFYLLTNNVYTSMNLVYFITSFLSGVFLFLVSKKMYNNNVVAFISSIIYLTYSYHVCDIYTRDAYAENFMFMVVPLILLGLLELIDDNYKKFYIYFVSGYVIGIYSHLVSMFFYTILLVLYLFYFRKDYFKINRFKKLVYATIVVMGLTLPFLTTILEHKLIGNYIVFSDDFSNSDFIISAILPFSVFFNHNKDAIYNNILVYLNYSVMVLFVITSILIIVKRDKRYIKNQKFLLFGILIVITFICSNSLWNLVSNIFSLLQFPWRLMVVLAMLISLYASNCYLYFKGNKKLKNVSIFILVIIMIIEGINNIYYYGDKKYKDTEINSIYVMGWQLEYLPISTKKCDDFGENCFDYLISRDNDIIINGDDVADVEIVDNSNFPNMIFKVNNIKKSVKLELPRIYYLGYEVKNENGKKVEVYENNNGFLEVKIKDNGKYYLKYTGTFYDKFAKFIRNITLIVLGIVLIIRKWREVKNEKRS
jgi:hypothetical protein